VTAEVILLLAGGCAGFWWAHGGPSSGALGMTWNGSGTAGELAPTEVILIYRAWEVRRQAGVARAAGLATEVVLQVKLDSVCVHPEEEPHMVGRARYSGEVKVRAQDEERLAVTRDVAAHVAGLSLRQVDYWAGTGLIEPATNRQVSPGRRVKLYSFVDLLSLMVAAELKRRNVSIQHIRTIVEHLRARGYEQPLVQLVFATLNGRVYFQHNDGSWEGDLDPDQLVLHEVLNLVPLRERITSVTQRDASLAGRIERRRGTLGCKAVLAGTRVPVDTIRRYVDAGRTTDEILESFPVLSSADVEAVREGAA
jgi:uncharacterized protein (DUF433 family)